MTKEVDEFCVWARPCNGTYLNPAAFNAMEVWRAAQAAVAARAPVAQWISVTDRLPADNGRVMVWPRPTDFIDTARFWGDEWAYFPSDYEPATIIAVTHWMPLPAPPAPADAGEAP